MTTEPSSLERSMAEEAGAGIGFAFKPDPAQLDLLRDDHGNLPDDALRRERAGRPGRGRPAGATNKASKDFARWFVGKYGDPASALGEIINTPDDVLYEEMVLAQGGERKAKRITGLDAKRLKMQALDIIMPYIHGKAPIRVDLNTRADVILNIPGLTDPAHLAQMVDHPELTEGALSQLEWSPFPARDTTEGNLPEVDDAD